MEQVNSSGADGGWNATIQGKLPLEACRLLAGLESGFVGGAAMLAWVGLAGMFIDRQPFWLVPNLLSTLFYGPAALHRSFTSTTVSGLALHAFASASLGMGFAFLVRDSRPGLRLVLVGLMLGLLWYHLSGVLIVRRLGALASLYISRTALLPGHLIFGLLLLRYPRRLSTVKGHFGWTGVPASIPLPAPAPVSDEPRPD